MNYFRKLLAATITAGFVLNAQAQLSCPLTNNSLTDLRAAASKLSTTVVLSANCQAYQDTINKSTEELKGLADRISTLDGTDPLDLSDPTDIQAKERQDLALKTVEQLNNLNSVFKSDKCGEEAAGVLDYADGFTDMVTGVSPFLALYGGAAAAPWVLGTTLGGAAAKLIIGFFKGKAVDMRKADQSTAFIKNSCAFYSFNQVKMSLDDLRLNQMPLLEVQLNAAKDTLSSLEKNSPPEPRLDLYLEQKASEKDKDRVLAIQSRLANDPMEACSYIGRYARGEDARDGKGLVERVWDLYVENFKSTTTNLNWEKDYFMSQLNFQLIGIPQDKAACTDLATRWVNKMIAVADAGQSSAKKIINENEEMKPYLAWVERKNSKAALVNTLEAKLKFFNMVTSSGFNIEYSEIIRGHKQVQDTLFESYRYLSLIKMKGLAEAWLKVKQEDAALGLTEFKSRKFQITKRLENIQKILGDGVELNAANIQAFAANYKNTYNQEHRDVHKSVTIDVCNQLRKAWSSWYGSLIHAEAGRDYCVAFDNVIDKMDYPDVQKICFGLRKGRPGNKSDSLRNLVQHIKTYRPKGEELLGVMKSLSCREAPETTSDLLKTKFD